MNPDATKPPETDTLPGSSGSLRGANPPTVVINSSPGPLIPDHELLRRIGGGSYGEVWLARNVIGSLHAVKIIYRNAFPNDRPFEREFAGIQKAMPVSRAIPGLVQILHVGRNDEAGYFYYMMELADDAFVVPPLGGSGSTVTATPREDRLKAGLQTYVPRTLQSETAARGSLPVQECVALGLTLTEALGQLHAQGLVHRDVKPSNIIFVRGAPKLADIGLMASAGEAQSFVGTAGFIPPEGPGTAQADLYSLGKVLYEISTGKDRQEFPQLPGDLFSPVTASRESAANSLPDNSATMPKSAAFLRDAAMMSTFVELNAVILKACQPDARARYQSAAEMHAELALLQRGQSVKRKRAAERRFALARIVGLIAVVLALFVASSWFLSSRKSEQKRLRWQAAEKFVREGAEAADKQTKEGLSKAVEFYHRAIASDAEHVPAYLGMVDTYISASSWHLRPSEAMASAKWAVAKALELDPKSADAHAWLGRIKQLYDYDWTGAERELCRAIELAPHTAQAHTLYAIFLAWQGRFDHAHTELALGRQLGNSSVRSGYDLGILLFFERRYDEAIAQARQMLTVYTNSVMSYSLLMDCYLKAERYQEAIAAAQTLRSLDDSPTPISGLGQIYGLMGRTNEARQYLQELERMSHIRYVSSCYKATVHLGLGEKDSALGCLERAHEERDGLMGGLKVDPYWDELRAEPRFIALLKQLNLEK